MPLPSKLRRHCIRSAAAVALAGLLPVAAWAQPAAPAQPATPTLLVLGDSLSAEYGLARGTGWVALLEKRLAAQKIAARVVNASVSGETTAGGRSRLPALLAQHRPAVVVIELGANDALRGLALQSSQDSVALQSTQDNLNAMVQAAQKAGARVLLVGMHVPPNYGSAYTRQFADLFHTVARERKVALVPFLLQGIAERADAMDYFQADRIHPNAKAQAVMLENVWRELRALLS